MENSLIATVQNARGWLLGVVGRKSICSCPLSQATSQVLLLSPPLTVNFYGNTQLILRWCQNSIALFAFTLEQYMPISWAGKENGYRLEWRGFDSRQGRFVSPSRPDWLSKTCTSDTESGSGRNVILSVLLPVYTVFLWRYSPNLCLGLPPWNSPFHFGLLDLRHSINSLVGWSARRKASTCTQTQKNTHIHTNTTHPCPEWDSTHGLGFRASEDSACLRPLGHRNRRL
jgi:hypothetical protein